MKLFLAVVVFIAMIFAYGLIVKGVHYETGKGEHVGYLTAVESYGIIWKTPSLYIKTELESSQEDKYCILKEDKELITNIENAVSNSKKVKLTYIDWIVRGVSNCDQYDTAVVTEIEILN